MNTPKIDWLARGLRHREQGMWPDALLCFEKATQDADTARAGSAHFYLGEAWWGLARLDKAVAAWQRGYDSNSNNMVCLQALTDALIHLGRLEEAGQYAQTVLSYDKEDVRALWVDALLRFKVRDADSKEILLTLIKEHVEILDDIAYARVLAQTFDDQLTYRDDDDQELLVLVETLLFSESLSASVLAMSLLRAFVELAPERFSEIETFLPTVLEANILPQDEDGLRALAQTLSAKGFAKQAESFAAHYARRQEAAYEYQRQNADTPPSNWSQRTQGALRIAWLLPGDTVRALIEPLANAITSEGLFSVFDVWSVNRHQEARAAQAIVGNTTMIRALAAEKPAEKLTPFDYDVLIDGAGLSWSCRTFFVERPARMIWSAVSPEALALPSVWTDKTFNDFSTLWTTLRECAKDLPPSSKLSAQAFFTQRDIALRAHRERDFETARAVYQTLLREQPQMAALHYLVAMLERDAQNGEVAEAHFDAAIQNAPFCGKTYCSYAEYLMERNIDRARAITEQGLANAPMALELTRIAGDVAMRRGDTKLAETMFSDLLRFEPTRARVHFDLGIALQRQNKLQEAARSYQRALLFDPNMIEAHFNLGALFQERSLFETAEAAYRSVLSLAPTHTRAYMQLGETLAAQGKIREWFENFKQFQTHCPSSLLMISQGLEASQFMGNYQGVDYFLERLRKFEFRAENNAELIEALDLIQYQFLFFDIEPELSLKMAKLYDEAMRKTFGAPLPRRAQRRAGKVRIGYLSADLCNHVMGRMIWSATRYHDQNHFELFFYSLTQSHDHVTENLKNLADHFTTLAGFGEFEAALRIAEDDLDILVDLSTNTKGSKPGILTLKPARVQITHVANAGTLGLSTIDFKLTDHFADIPEMQEFQIERFLAMRGCVYPYHHVEPATDHPYHRQKLGIPNDAVLLGAFVQPMKLSARCLALWRRVLEKIPKARLVFSPIVPIYVQIYRHLMKSAGIGEDRYLFLPIPEGEAMRQARYAIIDFVLDPMPYGNVNGALEPLDAGVPIVTLLGRRHGERTTYSILKNLGETRTVAESGNDYIEIAARLANDPAFMGDVREGIRKGLKESSLVDMEQHCRYLEEAYLVAIQQTGNG
ncbi:MAG: tetratricopeptide repeat protein [Burkholderiales bacterium]|jgi:predicted O-linked N-acetylglucosamine transferase (SPINDLY family)|nr:tetratricopeptide repeat protein [Burkholderiales bacterium]